MKFFKTALAAAAVVAFGFAGAFAQGENVIVTGIRSVTTASATLQVSVSTLSITNIATKGFIIAQGLGNLTTSITSFTKSITVIGKPFDNDVAEEIVDVLTGFVEVHQNLLNTIIGKHGLLSRFPFFGPPIAAALRAIEAVVDTFAFALIALIPTQKTAAQAQFAQLTVTFKAAIKTYS